MKPTRERGPATTAVSPSRAAAASILLRTFRDDAYASPLLAAESLDALAPEDRRLVQELVLGVLRWRGELDYVVNVTTGRPAEKLDLSVVLRRVRRAADVRAAPGRGGGGLPARGERRPAM